jgi:hypothetical protein
MTKPPRPGLATRTPQKGDDPSSAAKRKLKELLTEPTCAKVPRLVDCIDNWIVMQELNSVILINPGNYQTQPTGAGAIFAHEFGHYLGFDHSFSIMAADVAGKFDGNVDSRFTASVRTRIANAG